MCDGALSHIDAWCMDNFFTFLFLYTFVVFPHIAVSTLTSVAALQVHTLLLLPAAELKLLTFIDIYNKIISSSVTQ